LIASRFDLELPTSSVSRTLSFAFAFLPRLSALAIRLACLDFAGFRVKVVELPERMLLALRLSL